MEQQLWDGANTQFFKKNLLFVSLKFVQTYVYTNIHCYVVKKTMQFFLSLTRLFV